VEPEIFQPLISGQDFTQIKYRFDRGGFVANIKIIDHQGRVIRQLAHNELLGTEGFFRWDGDQDNGSRARMGYYLVSFEIFDEGGILKTYKRRVAVY
jgi:flagellar hook assembly protein FlgD